jgi:hypothetical protein
MQPGGQNFRAGGVKKIVYLLDAAHLKLNFTGQCSVLSTKIIPTPNLVPQSLNLPQAPSRVIHGRLK